MQWRQQVLTDRNIVKFIRDYTMSLSTYSMLHPNYERGRKRPEQVLYFKTGCNLQHIYTLYIYIYSIYINISIQPLGRFWQEPEPSQASGMALERCILGKFLGVICHCFPLYIYTHTYRVFHDFMSELQDIYMETAWKNTKCFQSLRSFSRREMCIRIRIANGIHYAPKW
jgi:hypothetical protein